VCKLGHVAERPCCGTALNCKLRVRFYPEYGFLVNIAALFCEGFAYRGCCHKRQQCFAEVAKSPPRTAIAHEFSSLRGTLVLSFLLFWTTQQRNHVTHTRRLQLKTIPLILISIILGPLGNVFLGKGMKSIGSITSARIIDLLPIASRILTSGYIWLGIVCLLGFFVVHMLLLTWADYSYVQPTTSVSYLSIAILSYLVLGEMISPLRWLGVSVICLGVLLVGRTSPSTSEAPEHA
jgi:drug/metabolite transporter (DMT)-like permease